MISSISTQSLSMMPQMTSSTTDAVTSGQNAGGVSGAKGSDDRPPPPPPPPPEGEGAGTGEAPSSADPAALMQSLFEALDMTEESSDDASILEVLTATAADGYEAAQSMFAA